MSQHDYVLNNNPGAAFRSDINLALLAIASNNSGTTEPAAPYAGMYWLDMSFGPNGRLKLRNAANSAWIDVSTVMDLAAARASFDVYTKAEAQDISFLANTRNRIINPAFQLSQQNGNTANGATLYFPADQWNVNYVTSAGVISTQRVQSRTPGGAEDRIRVSVTTIDAALAAGEYLQISHLIEGYKVADFQWGTAAAKQAVMRFGFKGPAGTYGVAIRNSSGTRSYVAQFTITVPQADTDTLQTIVIPGDVTGTWLKDNNIGFIIGIILACGTTFQGVLGWQASSFLTTSAQFQGLGNTAYVYELFDVGLYLDFLGTGIAPRFVVPDYQANMLDCFRYYWVMVGLRNTYMYTSSTTLRVLSIDHPVPMRVVPTQTSTISEGAGTVTSFVDTTQVAITGAAAGNQVTLTALRLNARM